MAQTTIGTFLVYRETEEAEWQKLVDIKDYPDLGGAPEQIDATTLSHKQRVSENGVQNTTERKFTANYGSEEYDKLQQMAASGKEYYFGVWFDIAPELDAETGVLVPNEATCDKHSFKGKVSAYPAGGGVNGIRDLIITLSASTDIVFTKHTGTAA